MSDDQQALHDLMLKRLLTHINEPEMARMDLGAAMQMLTEFYAGSLFYLCSVTNRMDLLDAKVISGEVREKLVGLMRAKMEGKT